MYGLRSIIIVASEKKIYINFPIGYILVRVISDFQWKHTHGKERKTYILYKEHSYSILFCTFRVQGADEQQQWWMQSDTGNRLHGHLDQAS